MPRCLLRHQWSGWIYEYNDGRHLHYKRICHNCGAVDKKKTKSREQIG